MSWDLKPVSSSGSCLLRHRDARRAAEEKGAMLKLKSTWWSFLLPQSQEPLSPFSRIRSESNNSTLPPSFRSLYLDSTKRLMRNTYTSLSWFRRFDDYSFYYDEYLDMEECWEDSDQVSLVMTNVFDIIYNINGTQEEGKSIFCSGTTPPPPYTLAINV